jgi:hypothetical protein
VIYPLNTKFPIPHHDDPITHNPSYTFWGSTPIHYSCHPIAKFISVAMSPVPNPRTQVPYPTSTGNHHIPSLYSDPHAASLIP